MTMKADMKTLVPGFKSTDPYSWLWGNGNYELPAEWQGLLADVPEKHAGLDSQWRAMAGNVPARMPPLRRKFRA